MFKLYQRCSVFIEFMFRGWTKIAQQFNEILGTDIDKAKIRKKYEAEKKKEKVKRCLIILYFLCDFAGGSYETVGQNCQPIQKE